MENLVVRETNQTIHFALAAGLVSVPFLNPYHATPIVPTFYAECTAITFGVALASRLLPNTHTRIPTVSLCLASIGIYAAMQPVLLDFTIAGRASIYALYVLYAGLVAWCGSELRVRYGKDSVLDVIAVALVIGAMANAAVAFCQYYWFDTVLELVWPQLRRNGHPYGFLGQHNQVTDYVTIGLVSALYLWNAGKARIGVITAAIAVLLTGLTITVSRAIWMYLAILIVLSALKFKRIAIALIAISLVLGVTQSIAPPNSWNPTGITRLSKGLDATVESARISLNSKGLGAWMEKPIQGIGAGQFLAKIGNEIGNHTHNLFTQVLAECGLIGLALVVVLIWKWSKQFVSQKFSKENWYIAVILSVMFSHSMVEFPLWYATFLGLFALILGIGSEDRSNHDY